MRKKKQTVGSGKKRWEEESERWQKTGTWSRDVWLNKGRRKGLSLGEKLIH